jgi:integrase
LTPEAAREAARDVLARLTLGRGEPREQKAALSVADIIERFKAEHVSKKLKPGTAEHYADVLGAVGKAYGAMKAHELRREHVQRLHSAMCKTPYRANRVLAALSSCIKWAAETALLPDTYKNPCARIKRYAEVGRERYLSEEELVRLNAALTACEPRFGSAIVGIRLLLLTGCRCGEILGLKWRNIDLKAGRALIESSKTGRKWIVLNKPAVRVLEGLERRGELAITKQDGAPRRDLRRPWQALCRMAGLKAVRLHDLRHSHASISVGLGNSLHVTGKILGHARPATTARYAHLADAVVRDASEAIGEAIERAMGVASAATAVGKVIENALEGREAEVIPMNERTAK